MLAEGITQMAIISTQNAPPPRLVVTTAHERTKKRTKKTQEESVLPLLFAGNRPRSHLGDKPGAQTSSTAPDGASKHCNYSPDIP